MATTVYEAGRRIALADIRVPENVRALDDAHVRALAGSIKLQGMLVPVVVRNDGDSFELVAGFRRIAAARSLRLAAVPVVVRDAVTEDADRAVENITRKQLSPYEEAKAVRAMLDRGLREDGAAQALGWPKSRVTARVKILELPERTQQLIGEAVIHLAAVDQLRSIGTAAPELLDAVIVYLDDGNAWAAERLTREPGWVLHAALTHASSSKVFAAYLHSTTAQEIVELRLGKKTEQLYAQAERLHNQRDRLRLRAAARALHGRRRRPGARRRGADRVRARPADHRRPHAVSRACQARHQAHLRRPRGEGDDGRQGEEDRARRQTTGRSGDGRQARARRAAP